MSNNVKMKPEDVREIIAEGKTLESEFGTLRLNYEKYRDMYFMNRASKPKNANVDKNDWKITPSPSARNEVTGVSRLVNTSEMHVEVVENNQSSKNSDKIERGLKRIVEVSGEGRKSRILSDAALATSLYGIPDVKHGFSPFPFVFGPFRPLANWQIHGGGSVHPHPRA